MKYITYDETYFRYFLNFVCKKKKKEKGGGIKKV